MFISGYRKYDMNIKSSNVDIKTDERFDRVTVSFTVKGYLSYYSAALSAKALKDIIKEHPYQKVNLMFDLERMTNYESQSKKLWVETLGQLSSSIDKTVVISDSYLRRLFAKYSFRNHNFTVYIYKSNEELSEAGFKFAVA